MLLSFFLLHTCLFPLYNLSRMIKAYAILAIPCYIASLGFSTSSSTFDHNRTKPMVAARHDRPVNVPLVSPSHSFASEDEDPMSKVVSLSSTSKREVKNLKLKLISEVDKVRIVITRFDPQGGNKKIETVKKSGHGGTVHIFRNCNNLLRKLMTHKYGWVFNVPVDAEGLCLRDYHTIVKEPMDLGTVKSKLGEGLYNSPLDFAEDVRLTFNNAILYNPMGNDVHSMAKLLLSMFEEKWVSIEVQLDSLPIVDPLPAPTVLKDRTLERVESMTTPVETPVDNRDLTLDEKRRLIEELQDLPCDKLETVVQIIKKSNPELSQQDDDEIELDIDSLDIQTLWELYRFVTGYKESLNNRKEDQGFGSERDAESAHNIIQEPADSDSDSSSGRGLDAGN
ncbi:transcription factor GTE5, chloroplastic-like [Brassica napus]|nr:transcription factor GTE5, chloroplastic-like [Brassica napus]